jgi:uncharacterized repeat protein (TIGR01451 family)
LLKWGSPGSGDGQFASIYELTVDSAGNVYVTDGDNHRVQKFDSNGNFLCKWGQLGSGVGEFFYPLDVGVDGAGNVYVSDERNHRIQKFDGCGNFLLQWGGFTFPRGLEVGSSGNVYVADTWNHRIQKFDSNGNFLLTIGSSGDGDGQLRYPDDVAIDNAGNIYVADTHHYRIQKFDSSGNYLLKWGSQGSADGQFDLPVGIAVDSSGNVYVADTNNNRIQKFDSNGNFLLKWGTQGSGDGQLITPEDVVVESSGKIYVSDSGNWRVQKFSPDGLVAHYKFDEGSGTTALDSSGNGNHGDIVGPTYTTGKVGTALDFDGMDDYVEMPAFLGGAKFTAFTLEAWINLDDPSKTEQDIFSIIRPNNGEFGVAIYPNETQCFLNIASGTPVGYFIARASNTYAAQQWYHIACSWDGTTLKFYIDGQLKDSVSVSGTMVDNFHRNYIGNRGVAGSNVAPADGRIDEAKIWNRALDCTELDYPCLPSPSVTAIKEASNSVTGSLTDFKAGDVIKYTVVLSNTGGTTLSDDAGPEFTDTITDFWLMPNAGASATSGVITYTRRTRTYSWNGSIAPGASVTLTFSVRTLTNLEGTRRVCNQGTAKDGAGGTVLTSDPTPLPGLTPPEPTCVDVVGRSHIGLPLALKGIEALLVGDTMHFMALGTGIEKINVQVFSLTGKRVHTSGWVANGHEWKLEDSAGRKLANGVYLYVMSGRGYDEKSVKIHVKKLIIGR